MIQSDILIENEYVIGVDGVVRDAYSIAVDSRDISPKDVFVALDGTNFRGVHFIGDCLKSGAELVVVKKDDESESIVKKWRHQGHSFSVVYATDTTHYFQEVARLYLESWRARGDGIVIGITGSNGKTTGKDMLYHIFETIEPGKVWCTHKNFNNHIGVPLTVLGLKPEHKIVIVEMGTNHPGELRGLCEVSSPDAGFITNIGESHLEFFHDKRGVFEEKRTLHDAIKKNGGFFIVNQDDEYLKNLDVYEKSLSYGKTGKDAKFVLSKNGFELDFKGERIKFENESIKGGFNYFNMGMCVSLAMALFPRKRGEIIEAADSFVSSDPNRSNWIKNGEREIFLDAYNANPSSMMASLEFFIERTSGHEGSLFILGDMNELGAKAKESHQKVGDFLARQSVGEAVFIGRHAHEYNEGFGGNAKCYDSLSSFEKDWPRYYSKHKKFFIKGSRSLQLESLMDIKD